MEDQEILDTDIAELEREAGVAGDREQVALCRAALAGDARARAECERVIAWARRRSEDRDPREQVRS